MAGNRQSKLMDLVYGAGVVTNTTDRGAKGRYKDSNRVRWHKGLPEKISGWARLALASTVEAVTLPDPPVDGAAVDYVLGSKDVFSPTAATTINLSLVNSDVDVDSYPDAVVALTIAMVASSALITAPTAISIGGVSASIVSSFSTTTQVMLVVATVRVPVGGFSTNSVVITWPSMVVSGTTVRASANAFYNVDPTSDAFALGYVTDTEADAGQIGTVGTSGNNKGFSATGAPLGVQIGQLDGSALADRMRIGGYYIAECYANAVNDTLTLTLTGSAPTNLSFGIGIYEQDFFSGYSGGFISSNASVSVSGVYTTWVWSTAGIDFGGASATPNIYELTSAMSVPEGGAVFVANMQSTGGDFDAIVASGIEVPRLEYTMQSPDVSVSGRYYMTGYRLFSAAATAERIMTRGQESAMIPVIAFVMAGTA